MEVLTLNTMTMSERRLPSETRMRLPSQVRLDEAARLAGVTTNRLTGAWRQQKLVAPWSGNISLVDLIRAVVAAHLQRVFGEQSGCGLSIAKAIPEGQLRALLDGEANDISVTLDGASFSISFPPDVFAAIRDELLATAGW